MRALTICAVFVAVSIGLNLGFPRQVFSTDLTLLARQANQALREGNYKRAISLTSTVIDLSPNASAFVMRSGAYYELHDYKNALADANRAVEIDPKLRVGWERRALAHFASGDKTGAASDAIHASNLDPLNPIAINMTADILFSIKDYKRAKLYYDKALRVYETGLGGPAQRTVAVGVKNQAHVTEISSGMWVAPAYCSRAKCLEALGQYQAAIADMGRAIKITSENPDCFVQRAQLKEKLGDKKGARADYDAAIESDPEDSIAYQLRARLRASLGDRAGADKDLATEKSLTTSAHK